MSRFENRYVAWYVVTVTGTGTFPTLRDSADIVVLMRYSLIVLSEIFKSLGLIRADVSNVESSCRCSSERKMSVNGSSMIEYQNTS